MKSIGGYLELELNKHEEFHSNLIGLNTGKNALELILKCNDFCKVYIPFYTCEIVHQTFQKLKINVEYYNIDMNFEPIFDFKKTGEKECFLYTNYFGLKSKYIKSLDIKTSNFIIDNAQAFYSKPIENSSTFYSARKFFGVPDGSYLYINKDIPLNYETDISLDRIKHLLIRKELNAELGYKSFIESEKKLKEEPVKLMSQLTKSLLKNIDYNVVAEIRIQNFNYLHENLGNYNKLKINIDDMDVPLVYPYWSEDYNLKSNLKANNIYTATYWPNIKLPENQNFLNEITFLPIDQSIGESELNKIIDIIISGRK